MTNSFGDTSEISFNAVVVDDDPEVKRIKLKKYITYTTVGETVDFEDNISDLNGTPENKVTIDSSEYKPNVPGVYSIYYEAYGYIRGCLLVVVEEAE